MDASKSSADIANLIADVNDVFSQLDAHCP
jgi:hypothetical protein